VSGTAKFKDYLRTHLNFLAKSAAAFDEGEIDECMRIAVSIRVLLHDTRNSTSLLTHLNAKHIYLTSTCQRIPEGAVVSGSTMVFNRIIATPSGPRAEIRASLGDGPPINFHLKAEDWWNQTIVVLPRGSDRRVSRKDIVLVAANKDGGAHVDASLTPQYDALKERGGTLQLVCWKIDGVESKIEFEDIHAYLIRQMAYELLTSPALLALAAESS
jgi:hypothetical protein